MTIKYILLALCMLLLLSACAQSIEQLKTEENVGEKVYVQGTVKNSIKIGKLSGYTVEDSTGSIGVQSDTLPKDGDKISVRGTLIKDSLFGYYIKVD